jgi:hypothetical protein
VRFVPGNFPADFSETTIWVNCCSNLIGEL